MKLKIEEKKLRKQPTHRFFEHKVKGNPFHFVLIHKPVSTLPVWVVSSPQYKLNLVKVYELRTGSSQGILVGYAFSTKSTVNIKVMNSYVLFSGHTMNRESFLDAEKKIVLRYKIPKLRIFSYKDDAILVCLDRISKITEKFDE